MGKKGKKTKKQLEEELAKQQEDQRRSDEASRIKKLEDGARTEQEDRLTREHEKKMFSEEMDRLELENSAVEQLKRERKHDLDYELDKLEDRAEWQKFLACCKRPDPRFESEITSYLSQTREEMETDYRLMRGDGPKDERPERMSIDEWQERALAKCVYGEEIISDLDDVWCIAKEEEDVPKQEWCNKYKRKIRSLMRQIIDQATSVLLQRADELEQNPRQETHPYPEYSSTSKQPNERDGSSRDPSPKDPIKMGFWGLLQSKGWRAKVIDWQKLNISLELPKSIAQVWQGHCIGARVVYSAYDWVTCDTPAPQSGVPMLAVGGIMRVDLLSIPTFPKKAETWTMRNVPTVGHEVERLPYPNDREGAAPAPGSLQPCKVDLRVPDNVVLRTSIISVSWWDEHNSSWSDDHISEVHWDEDSRTISFFSLRVAAFSITQERYLEFPYKWWTLRSLDAQVAELTIQANRFEIKIHISADGVALLAPALPELHTLMYCDEGNPPTRRVLRPGKLFLALQRSGINMMPVDEDADYVDGMTPKCGETEARAYSDISELASVFDVASSRHNKKLPRDQAICRIRENLYYEEYDPMDLETETDYKSVLFWPNKCGLVQSLESVSPCVEDLQSGHLTHAALSLALEPVASPEAQMRMSFGVNNVRFVETVRKTMSLLRLLSFV